MDTPSSFTVYEFPFSLNSSPSAWTSDNDIKGLCRNHQGKVLLYRVLGSFLSVGGDYVVLHHGSQSPKPHGTKHKNSRRGCINGPRRTLAFEVTYFGLCNISNTRDSVSSGLQNNENRVENMTRSGVFLQNSRCLDSR